MAWEHDGHTVTYVEHCVTDVEYTVVGAAANSELLVLRVREQSSDEVFTDVTSDEAWCHTCAKRVVFDEVEWTCD